MEEHKLNERYKFIYDSDNGFRIYDKDLPFKKPKKLFKFYDTDLNNVASLHDNYVWLGKPSGFNDPFDCNLNLIKHKKPIQVNNPSNLQNIGISSFSEINDELLLWAHYANNYRGFCIEFDPKKLSFFPERNNTKYSLDPVLYFEEFIEVEEAKKYSLQYLLTAKANRWEYEKEWRLISTLNPSESYNRLLFYKLESVKALYIGYRLLNEQESIFNLLQSIFHSKYPGKPIYRVTPNTKKKYFTTSFLMTRLTTAKTQSLVSMFT